MAEELQADYLHRYEGVHVGIHQVSQFDDSSDASTTYFSNTDKIKKTVIKTQEQFSITDYSTTVGTLLDGTECKIHSDSSATKSLMSKQYYPGNKFLHGSPKFSSKAKVIQVGYGESIYIIFIIAIIITIEGHMFEIFCNGFCNT